MAKKQGLFFDRYAGPLAFAMVICLVVVALSWQMNRFYQTHFLPRTSVAGLDISGLTYDDALSQVDEVWSFEPDDTLTIVARERAFSAPVSQLGFTFQTRETLGQMLGLQQRLTWWQKWQYLLTGQSLYLDAVSLNRDYDRLLDFLGQVEAAIAQPGRQPSITLDDDYITIDPGQQQVSLDWEKTLATISHQFPAEASLSASLHVSEEFVPLTTAQVSQIQDQARALKDKKLVLMTSSLNNFSVTMDEDELIPLLLPPQRGIDVAGHALFAQIDPTVSRQPQEPVLQIDESTKKVTQFVPPRDGLTLDETQFLASVRRGMEQLFAGQESASVTLPLVVTPPTRSLADVNNYGISERIGFGESYYDHSSSGRIHNVAVAASRIDGTLVAPGEEFSFNRAVGDVSAASGYQPGYVIQGGRSVLSAGGGVCQVSTTVFRALLDSGLQITLRRPHSYRVTYYELNNDPGFDATVYSGNVDLRFINDTDHYVLITTHTDSQALYMYVEIWGSDDGRTTTITDYRKFNAVGAPPPQYIEDPSLAPGQVKQIDWAVGGLQTTFTHTIYNADGSIRSQKEYPSHYQAWSAKYLVGPSN